VTDAAPASISVIIPARNEAASIDRVVKAVLEQGAGVAACEVIVVDDGSTDDTAALARAAGARLLRRAPTGPLGNPAAARNLGVSEATGDVLVFLDANCVPALGWLAALLDAHQRGESVVGGSLVLPEGLGVTARTDYYCGWYHVHERRPAGSVPNHPPCNLSVRRALLRDSAGFAEEGAAAYAHEELVWQSQLRDAGYRIHFEPRAMVLHHNRRGLGNLLRRNYRWGYSAVETKAATGTARWAGLYRHPRLLIAAAAPLALARTLYILGCWLRARRFEPLLLSPLLLVAGGAYCWGMATGTARWLRRAEGEPGERPRWE